MSTISTIASYIINLINTVLVPLVFAVAFAMFLFGVFKFFFMKVGDAKAREEGRGFIIGGIVAFAVMLSVWGLVNLVRGTLPIVNSQPPLPTFNSTGGSTGTGVTNTGTGVTNSNSDGTGVTGSQPSAASTYYMSGPGGTIAPADPNSNNSDYGDLPIQSSNAPAQ